MPTAKQPQEIPKNRRGGKLAKPAAQKVDLKLLGKADSNTEVEQNYTAFEALLPRIIKKHRGQFALMHHGEIVAYYDSIGEAYNQALEQFPDHVFSIQEVTDEVIYLGPRFHALSR